MAGRSGLASMLGIVRGGVVVMAHGVRSRGGDDGHRWAKGHLAEVIRRTSEDSRVLAAVGRRDASGAPTPVATTPAHPRLRRSSYPPGTRRHRPGRRVPGSPTPGPRGGTCPVALRSPRATAGPATTGHHTKQGEDSPRNEARHEEGAGRRRRRQRPQVDGEERSRPSRPRPSRPPGPRSPVRPKKFLDEQRGPPPRGALPLRAIGTVSLRAEADALIEGREPGDVQFDEESGEGDTLAVERERDLALSAQARAAVDEIDAALGSPRRRDLRHLRRVGQADPPRSVSGPSHGLPNASSTRSGLRHPSLSRRTPSSTRHDRGTDARMRSRSAPVIVARSRP